MKRKLSFLLALCMLIGSLVMLSACNPTEEESGDGGDVLDVEWAKDLDFGGKTLLVSQSINVWDPTSSIDNAAKFTMATKANNADSVLNACYERNESVKRTLNLNVQYIETDMFYNELADYILGIITQQQAIDLIINDVYAVVPAATNGYLFNVKTTDFTSHFNFDHDSWYDDYMEGLTLDKSKMYAVAGHYFMDVVRTAHCLYVNTDIFDDKCSEMFSEIDDFYEYIDEGNFTYDDLYDLIYLAWEDRGELGVTDEEDLLGLFIHEGAAGHVFIYNACLSAFDYTGNIVVMKPSITEEVETVALAYNNIMHQDGTLFAQLSDPLSTDLFTEGGTLFINGKWIGNLEHSEFQAMDNKAAIVYPKVNADYEYSTYVHDSAEIGYIPTTCLNFTEVSAYVQLLNEQSTSIINNYFNNQLKYKYSTAETNAAIGMLDLLNETIGSPAYNFLEGRIASEGDAVTVIKCVYNAVCENNPTNAATNYSANAPAYETGLTSLLEKFAALP